MAERPDGYLSLDQLEKYADLSVRVAERCYADPVFRRSMETDGRTALAGMGLELPPGFDVKTVANTSDRMYVVLPPNPNMTLGDETLAALAGGDFSSLGCGASASSWSCPFGSVGSFSTLGTSKV